MLSGGTLLLHPTETIHPVVTPMGWFALGAVGAGGAAIREEYQGAAARADGPGIDAK